MRWYFAIDEAGSLGATGAQARLAVLTAQACGGLEPKLLYSGGPSAFTEWMTAHGVEVIRAVPDFLPEIRAAEAAGKFRAWSIGHWLRLAIPAVEHKEEFVLYTDCDILFLRRVEWATIKPKIFAASPEFKPDNWNYFNSGVMVLNVPAMRASYPQFRALIVARILSGSNVTYDDQYALNEGYRGHWIRLDPLCNWKPYWPYQRRAAVLHLHGPKLEALEAIATHRWRLDNPTAIQLSKMVDGHLPAYISWCNALTDLLQNVDMQAALRFSRLASALVAYAKTAAPVTDYSFMNFKMFPE